LEMKKRNAWPLIPLAAVLLAACGGGTVSQGCSAPPAPAPPVGAAPWPLPSDPMSLAVQAGLTPGTHEFFTYHVHAHLDIFVNGRPRPGSWGPTGRASVSSPRLLAHLQRPRASGGQPLGLTGRRPSSDPLERGAR
jgi:hypothetical protein